MAGVRERIGDLTDLPFSYAKARVRDTTRRLMREFVPSGSRVVDASDALETAFAIGLADEPTKDRPTRVQSVGGKLAARGEDPDVVALRFLSGLVTLLLNAHESLSKDGPWVLYERSKLTWEMQHDFERDVRLHLVRWRIYIAPAPLPELEDRGHEVVL